MDSVIRDSRAILRSLRKNPGFAATAILTTALAIGVNTAMFTVVHATLLAPLPYPDADRLTYVWKDLLGAGYQRAPLSPPELVDLRRAASHYESMGAILTASGTLVEGERPEALRLGLVTPNFLTVFGVPPVVGRFFTAEDGMWGGPANIIISGELWQGRFNGADVVGRRIRVDGGWGGVQSTTYTIVGVMPVGFEMLFPSDARVPRVVDGWIPFRFDFSLAPRGVSYLSTVGRLEAGANLADAQAQLETVGRSAQYAGSARRFLAAALDADLMKDARPALVVLQTAVGLVLLVACASIAALQLVRAQARRAEVGVRAALGASRLQLARLLLIEGLLLAVIGGLLGVALATFGVRLLPLVDVAALPRGHTLTLNLPVLAFSTLATLASALVFGIVPLVEWRGNSRLMITPGGPASMAPPPRARRTLVVAEVGISVVLLIGAGLLVRTFVNLRSIDPGYRSEQVLTFQLALPSERYGNPLTTSTFTRQLEQAMRVVPGVEAAGVVNQIPLDDSLPNGSSPYWTRETAAKPDAPIVDARLVTPGYFDTLRARLASGRSFSESDDETQPLVLMVDETLARRAWPKENPVGQELGLRLWNGNGFGLRWGRVVGVVHHLRHHRLTEDVREQIFIPFTQAPRTQMSVVLRTAVDPESLIRAVSTQIRQIDPDLAPARVQPLDRLMDRSRAPARLSMLLSMLFAALSLLLTCIGLYGVISYSVNRRTSELGVRAALGATRRELVRLVLGQGVALTAIGVVLGLLGSVAAARWMKGLLFGVTAFDPAVYLAVPIALACTALLACYVPARRAGRIDPTLSLRAE